MISGIVLGLGARYFSAAPPLALVRLENGNVIVNSISTPPALTLVRLGNGNVRVETAQ